MNTAIFQETFLNRVISVSVFVLATLMTVSMLSLIFA